MAEVDVPITLPDWVTTGRVRGQQIVVGIDTAADADTRPDAATPVGAKLLFTPTINYQVYPSRQTTLYFLPRAAVVGSDGQPRTPDGDDLYLEANDPDVWSWTVTPTINRLVLPSFRMDVLAGQDNYLSDWQPIAVSSPAALVARGPRGLTITDVSLGPGHQLVFELEDSSTVPGPSLDGVYAAKPTGTPDGTRFYRDDGVWAAIPGGAAVVTDTGWGGADG